MGARNTKPEGVADVRRVVPPCEEELKALKWKCAKATQLCRAMKPDSGQFYLFFTVGNAEQAHQEVVKSSIGNRFPFNLNATCSQHFNRQALNRVLKISILKVSPLPGCGSPRCSFTSCTSSDVVTLTSPVGTEAPRDNTPVNEVEMTETLTSCQEYHTSHQYAQLTTSDFNKVYQLIQNDFLGYGFPTKKERTREESEAEPCCICMARKPTTVLPGCLHNFCSECITNWNDVQHSCPLCRRELSPADIQFSWDLLEPPSADEAFSEVVNLTRLLDINKGHRIPDEREADISSY